MLTQYRRFRSYVLASSVAAITIVGTITGSMLNTQSVAKKEIEKPDMISLAKTRHALEQQRAALVQREMTIEKKLQDLKAKVAKSNMKGIIEDSDRRE